MFARLYTSSYQHRKVELTFLVKTLCHLLHILQFKIPEELHDHTFTIAAIHNHNQLLYYSPVFLS